MKASALSLLFAIAAFRLPAQEICNDGSDNDLDWLYDCADPDCPCEYPVGTQNRYQCGPDITMWQVDKEQGSGTIRCREWDGTQWNIVCSSTNKEANAIGYDNKTGLLFGISKTGFVDADGNTWGPNSLIKISRSGFGAHGAFPGVQLAAPGVANPANYYYVGSCDLDGNLFVMSGADSKMYKINLATLSVTLVTLTATPLIADFAWSWRDGEFLSWRDNAVVSISQTGTVTTQAYTGVAGPPTTGGPGAVFYTYTDKLILYFNNGEMWELSRPSVGSAWNTAVLLNAGPVFQFNDGASCSLCNLLVEPETDCTPPPQPQELNSTPGDPRGQMKSARPYIGETPQSALMQNMPNPTGGGSSIRYTVGDLNAKSAQISISDSKGLVLINETVPVAQDGFLMIESRSLPPGLYQYTLLVDGLAMDTKRMIVVKE